MRICGWAAVVLFAACAEPTPQRTPDGGLTVACTTESDCAAPAPYCEPTTSTCVACRFTSHCGDAICENQACRPARSCKELHDALPGLASGAYTLDHDGSGAGEPVEAYCDMTTAGGGWTALLNPTVLATPTHPALVSTTATLSGTQSCESQTVPTPFTANGWHGLRSYACGIVTFELALGWSNTIDAAEVMFVATLQGENTRTLTVNGTPVAPAASSIDAGGATCVFYNGANASSAPALNACTQTYLDAAPQVVTGALAGDLSLVITTGAACAPTCNHGTGMNIQKLFVR